MKYETVTLIKIQGRKTFQKKAGEQAAYEVKNHRTAHDLLIDYLLFF